MSKENALSFLQQVAANPELQSQVKGAEQASDFIDLGEAQGYAFSPDHVREVIPELKAQRGFFGDLVEAILELFSPNHDNYPATGVQPFSGETPRH